MNSDRFGYFDNGYHFWPDLMRGAEFYGFDKSDPVYRKRTPYRKGQRQCLVCRDHFVDDRRFPCDVEMARARDMESVGYPATFCRGCSRAMPVRSDQSDWLPKCWRCERAMAKSRRVRRLGSTVRVSDGLGCSERLPAWTLDPNEGRF
jgi:hypothetical protein